MIWTLILPFTFYSCDFDQVVSKYPDYDSATAGKFFEKGWIPHDAVATSMTNIFLRTNLDINTCIFSYNLSEADLDIMKEKIQETTYRFQKVRRIKTPSAWTTELPELKHYLLLEETGDTVFIAINEADNKIYGWRK